MKEKEKEKMVLLLPSKKYGSHQDITEIQSCYDKIIEEDGRFDIVLTICDSEIEVVNLVRLKDWIDSKCLLLNEIKKTNKDESK